MAPPQKKRPSAFDRFAGASAAAVSSGFSTVLAMGPQPAATGRSTQMGTSDMNTNPNGGHGSGNKLLSSLQPLPDFPMMDEMSDNDSDTSSEQGGKRTRAPASGKKKAAAAGPSGATARSGASKEANSEGLGNPDADRKEQNRVAQREFRQRKQQYIRALEARVELLSSDHDVQVDRLRFALRGLLAENNQLRSIVASFAEFVGSQKSGGPLQKAGISRSELEELIDSSAEKVMTDAWQNWPGATESEALRQLRLEAKLPPEGLPESARLPEHAIANTNAAKAKGSELGTGHSTQSSPLEPNKDGTGEAEKTKKKRKSSMSAPSKEATKKASAIASGVAGPIAPSEKTSTPLAGNPIARVSIPGPSHMPQQAAPTSMPMQAGMSGIPSGMAGAPGHHMPTGQTFFSEFPHSGTMASAQDPASLMTGLFGAGTADHHGSTTFFNDHDLSFDFHFPGDLSQGHKDMGAFAHSTGSTMADTSLPLIAQQDDPEEVRRVAQLLARLQHEGEQHGTSQNAQSLFELGRTFRDLILHMAAFRRQPSYSLPRVLEPSEIQQTRPHDPLVDALPYPGIRQMLISQQDNFVIEDVVMSILHFTNLHSGDAMDEKNWELLHGFLIAYPQLIDQQTLAISNRWRAMRNEPPLSFDDIAP